MKKRLCAALLGVILFVSGTVSVCAERVEKPEESTLTSAAEEFRKNNALEMSVLM